MRYERSHEMQDVSFQCFRWSHFTFWCSSKFCNISDKSESGSCWSIYTRNRSIYLLINDVKICPRRILLTSSQPCHNKDKRLRKELDDIFTTKGMFGRAFIGGAAVESQKLPSPDWRFISLFSQINSRWLKITQLLRRHLQQNLGTRSTTLTFRCHSPHLQFSRRNNFFFCIFYLQYHSCFSLNTFVFFQNEVVAIETCSCLINSSWNNAPTLHNADVGHIGTRISLIRTCGPQSSDLKVLINGILKSCWSIKKHDGQ